MGSAEKGTGMCSGWSCPLYAACLIQNQSRGLDNVNEHTEYFVLFWNLGKQMSPAVPGIEYAGDPE